MPTQGRLQVSGKGMRWEGLVGDCGLVFPGADPRFQVIGGVLKKYRRAMRDAKIVCVFCVKNQDFMQKIIFFSNCRLRGAGCLKHKVAFAMNHY